MFKKLLLIVILALDLTACAPSAQQLATPVAATIAAWPTQTAYPTLTPNSTYTPNPTYTPGPTYTPVPTLTPKVIIVTPTFTTTPQYTPTITNTPAPTKDPTTSDKQPGMYLIKVDIASGVWRSDGTGDDCYWSVTTKTGDILDNHFGKAGGTAYLPPNGFQIEFGNGCGTWTYLGE